jgi:hypothetical protein
MPAVAECAFVDAFSGGKDGPVATGIDVDGFLDPFSGGDTPMTVVDCLIVDL